MNVLLIVLSSSAVAVTSAQTSESTDRNDKPGFENEIHRRYEIGMTIGDDGKVATQSKRIKEDNQ